MPHTGKMPVPRSVSSLDSATAGTVFHRCMELLDFGAAPAPDDIPLHLSVSGNAPALAVIEAPQLDKASLPSSPADRILQALSQANVPLTAVQLRKACRIRSSTISTTTAALAASGRIHRGPNGYSLSPHTSAVPVSLPLPL